MFILLLLLPLRISAFETSATSAILMDIDSGRIIYSKDIHKKRSVASISKIMTAIVAIESGKLENIVTVGSEIEAAYGSGIYIKQGENLKLIDLLYGLMLRSGNDAALSIANYIGGSVDNFVIMMNDKAKKIGMLNSEFNNPSGLDEDRGNYSTAYDMALLNSYAMKNDVFKKIVGTKNYKLETNMNYYSWTNKNKLLFSYKYITGGKTGFTEIARRTLVTAASKNNLNLTVVTLNDGNDFADHKNLYEEAFNNYTNYQILKSGELIIPNETYYKNCTLYINGSFTYPFMNEESNLITVKYKLNKIRNLEDGTLVGEAQVYFDSEQKHTEPIYIKCEETKSPNFFSKVALWFKKLW